MNTTKSFEEQTDSVRRRAAESLESAAASVRAAGKEGAGAIGDLANEAGERLDSTATFVRTLDPDPLSGLRRTVRLNPVGSLAAATAIGLVAGLLLRRGDRAGC